MALLHRRLLSRKAGRLLALNTVAGTAAFLVGLFLMWLFVDVWTMNVVLAAALSFMAANSLHYVFARQWVFRGTNRKLARGYGYFLVNAVVGLIVTVVLFAALVKWTSIHYLVARVLVSMVAGLLIFVLNATLNFKRL